MEYEPTVWQDGDTITSVRLNKLEQGVAAMGYEPTIWQDGDTITSIRLNKLEQGVATLSEESLGELVGIGIGEGTNDLASIYVSTAPYDIMSSQYQQSIYEDVLSNTNVCLAYNVEEMKIPAGCYVAMNMGLPSEWTTDNLKVIDDNNNEIVSGFESRTLDSDGTVFLWFTMQAPSSNGFGLEFSNAPV